MISTDCLFLDMCISIYWTCGIARVKRGRQVNHHHIGSQARTERNLTVCEKTHTESKGFIGLSLQSKYYVYITEIMALVSFYLVS